MKKVSIVLPVYNGESCVKRAIESVINQTYDDWELIVVNDCSTDNTLQIIEECAQVERRIKIIKNEENKKLPRSLNVGFSEATGEYLTWTSDDNTYHNDAIKTMVEYLEKAEDVDLVYSDFSIVSMDGKVIERVTDMVPSDLLFRNVVGACFLYRRSLYEKIGEYDPDLFLAEDYEYWIRAYLNSNLAHISQDLYDYTRHERSLTSTRMSDICKQTFRAKTKHFDQLLEKCDSQEERNAFFWSQLSLLNDKKEYKAYLKEYYKLDNLFCVADKRKRRKDLFRRIKRG